MDAEPEQTEFSESDVRERFIAYYKPGARWLGVVTRTTNFGAHVELPGYINGTVHIAQISDVPVNSVDEAVESGQFVAVRVLLSSMPGPLLSMKAVDMGAVQISPYPIDPSWRTDDVLGIARRMQADGYRDQGIVPILADALEEAGCDVPDLLEICRATRVPTQRYGWWIAEALLRA